jgi:hypothetical protein
MSRARFTIPAHWNALRTTSKPHSQPRRQTDQFIGPARNSALSPAKSFGACDGFPNLPTLTVVRIWANYCFYDTAWDAHLTDEISRRAGTLLENLAL